MWSKHTNYEEATHIPLLISAPGVTKANTRTPALAETVDLYPTLCELAGLNVPEKLDAIRSVIEDRVRAYAKGEGFAIPKAAYVVAISKK